MEKDSSENLKAFNPELKGRDPDQVAAQYSSQRTGMSFQRTRLSADRTLMSVIRTSLSLIGFGFTVFQFFEHLNRNDSGPDVNHRIRNFTLAMVALGVLILVLGIVYQINLMIHIRKERRAFIEDGLLPTLDKYPISMTLIVAVLLLLLGCISIISMIVQV